MSSRVFDGASVSLNRQISMLRHIRLNNKRGLKLSEIEFFMLTTHGNRRQWVLEKLGKWVEWGVVTYKNNRYRVDEEKWTLVLNMRQEEADRIEP